MSAIHKLALISIASIKRGSIYSSDAQTAINYYTGLTNGEKDAIAIFVDAEVANGNWAKAVYCQFMNLGTQNNSYIDCKGGKTSALRTVSTPITWTQWVGFKGNANSGLDTTFDPLVESMNLDNSAYCAYVVTANTESGDGNYLFGAGGSGGFVTMNDQETAGNIQYQIHGPTGTYSGNMTDGNLYSVKRESSTNHQLMDGGTELDDEADTSTSLQTEAIHFFGLWNGSALSSTSDAEVSLAYFGDGDLNLTALETNIETFNTAMDGGGGSPYSSETNAVLANLPDSMDTWLEEAIDVLVNGRVAAGEWTKVKYLLAGNLNTEDNSLTDWIQGLTAIKIADSTNPVWTQYTQWRFLQDGALDTKFKPNSEGVTVHDASYHLSLTSVGSSDPLIGNNLFGCEDDGLGAKIRFESQEDINSCRYRIHTEISETSPNTMSLAAGDLLTLRRSASDSQDIYENTTLIENDDSASSGVPDEFIFIGAENSNGTIDSTKKGILGFDFFIVSDASSDRSGWRTAISTFNATIIANINPDTEDPTAPTMAAAAQITATTATLSLSSPGTDNIGIVGYDWHTVQNGFEGNTVIDTFINLIGLTPNTSYDAFAYAKDAAGNLSPASNQVNFSTLVSAGTVSIGPFDWDTTPGQPPWRPMPDPPSTANRIVTDPTDGGNKVVLHTLDRPPLDDLFGSSNSRREFEYQNTGPIDPDLPPRNEPWLGEAGFSFRFMIPGDHDKDFDNVISIMQWHQRSSQVQSAPPFQIRTEIRPGDTKHSISPILRTTPLYKTHGGYTVLPNNQVWDTMADDTWYYFVIDSKWDHGGDIGGNPANGQYPGNGYHKVYVKEGSAPSSGDIILNYSGPTGFNDDDVCHLQIGMYMSAWRRTGPTTDSMNATPPVDTIKWYLDDHYLQTGPILS